MARRSSFFWLLLLLFGCVNSAVNVPVSDSAVHGDEGTQETLETASSNASGVDTDPMGGSAASKPTFTPRDEDGSIPSTLGGDPVTVYAHPRIWMSPEKKIALQSRATAENPMWVGVEDAVEDALRDGSYQTYAGSGNLVNFALAYLATGKATYLAAAETILVNFMNPARYDVSCDGSTYCGNDNIDYGSIDLMYLAAVYDWLYEDLAPATRANFRDWVYEDLIPFLRLHPYYGNTVHNLGHTKWCGEFLWALATLGDDARADSLSESTYLFWQDQILPLLDQVFPGGHTYSGSGYGYNRVFKYQLYAFEAAFTALGLNMYQEHPWPADEVYYRIHSMLPGNEFFLSDWESAEAGFREGRIIENEVILAQRYPNTPVGRTAQYFIQNVFRPRVFYNQGGTRVNPIYMGRWFLFYDPSLSEEDYTQTEATAYAADGLDVFMSREDWTDPNSTWVTLSSAPYVGDHQLHNEGSFKIFKREYLVVENGRFYAGQNSNLTPTDCNILFVGDGAVEYGNVTGGLYRRTTGSYAHLDRVATSTSGRFSYARADLTTAYHPTYFPLENFRRSLVHLKSHPDSDYDYVLIFDRVQSQNAEMKKSFVHLVENPTLSGSSALMVSTNGLSQLGIVNLLPAETSMTVESVSDKTGGGLPQESSDHPARLVFHTNGQACYEDQFFAGYAVTDNVGSAVPSMTGFESADASWVGALIHDESEDRVTLFAKSETPSLNEISYTVERQASAQHLILDLVPGDHYTVSISGSDTSRTITLSRTPSGGFEVNGQGLLVFVD